MKSRSRLSVPRPAEQHLARGAARRHHRAEPAGEFLGEHEVLLLQVDVGEHGGVVDEQRRAVADHRRGDHALQRRVDDRRAVHARLLDQRHALGERGHRDHEREVDRDLGQDRVAVLADVGDLRADRVEAPPRPDRTPPGRRRPSPTSGPRRASPGCRTPGSRGRTRRSRARAPTARRWRPARSCTDPPTTVPGRSAGSTSVGDRLDRVRVREHREQHVERLRASSAGESAIGSPSSSAFARVRFQTVTGWPASLIRRAIPDPIAPRPANPTCIRRACRAAPAPTRRSSPCRA